MAEADAREDAILREGVILRKEGAVEAALKRFDEVLEINPTSAIAYREKAITLQVMGEREEAMNEYKKALAIDPAYGIRDVGEVKGEVAARAAEKTPTVYSVRDVMTKDIVTVQLGATVKDAAGMMLKKSISSVAVREGGDILGIVTERDFIKNYNMLSGKDFSEIPVKDIMAYPLLAVSAGTDVEEAARQMGEQGVRHLLVRDGTEVVGLISLTDLLTVRPNLIEKYKK